MTVHHPVLLEPAIEALQPRSGGFYVDGTVGYGGHAEVILQRSGPNGRLLGIDRDPIALKESGDRLASYGDRARLRRGLASEMARLIQVEKLPAPDGVLLDLGVSSPQLDRAERGFSFQREGPLDMRMDPDGATTAADLVNTLGLDDLTSIIRRFGEEKQARRIAVAIVAERPFSTTTELADVIFRAVGGRRGKRTHPATKTFQALRIAVNDELAEVEAAVDAALDTVGVGGRVAIIAFHSLEDRLVKRAFRAATGVSRERDVFGHAVGPIAFRAVTRKPVKGEDSDPHPRARSARLRVVERCAVGVWKV
jgi:16S rRNA (cytosine1402-N4)-methyltransferase